MEIGKYWVESKFKICSQSLEVAVVADESKTPNEVLSSFFDLYL